MTRDSPTRAFAKSEMIIAALAMLISMLTLFVYVYQSTLMKQLQKMSVWPYLSFGPSWGIDYFRLTLINKGTGPAILKDVEITVDGQPTDGVEKIVIGVLDTVRANFSYSSLWPGQVIMTRESLHLVNTDEPHLIDLLLRALMMDRISIRICYSSVYGDTWISESMTVTESSCERGTQ